jgi:NADP-dependent 3-hydroxy acid dehydrogenase YdfG
MSLSGKVVLVTGASAGIGRASAVALARAGARIIATGRRAAELETLDAIETIAGDLNEAPFVAELAGRARNVDILVNNAGILKYEPLMEVDYAEFE